ncbi:hypothetical protein PVAP13_5NG416800, partial [Panicum virgatum]
KKEERSAAATTRRRTDGGKRFNGLAETRVLNVTFKDYVITTTVTSSGRAVERWMAEVLSVHRSGGGVISHNQIHVGLDVEWRPSNYGGQQNKAATLQLCVNCRCLVFQLLHADYFPAALARFLGDRSIGFYGVGVRADAERLRADHDLVVANAVDLCGYVADWLNRPDLRHASLRAIVAAVMGVELVKPHRVTMSRCDARRLSDEQISYACIDAFVSSEVVRMLSYAYRDLIVS